MFKVRNSDGREGVDAETDWMGLLESWDAQQDSSIPNREPKFEGMLEVLAAYLPTTFKALDLGSGPGSLSLRILRRFPDASVVAVDFDPVLLKIGQNALKDFGGRIAWVDADVGTAGWRGRLPTSKFDAVVSSTAIHWMDKPRVRRLYRDLARVLRGGGIFLNGDVMPWVTSKKLHEISEKIRYSKHGTLEVEFAPWREWWEKVEKEQRALASAFEEKKKRFANGQPSEGMLPIETHIRMIRQAGFGEVDTIWQNLLEDRVLAAIR
jgi:SAM-dependent methyltransferase